MQPPRQTKTRHHWVMILLVKLPNPLTLVFHRLPRTVLGFSMEFTGDFCLTVLLWRVSLDATTNLYPNATRCHTRLPTSGNCGQNNDRRTGLLGYGTGKRICRSPELKYCYV